ncbi:MAG: hypothetical protein OM95_14415 [Bdellovibrio sp. ArHS]|uniref:trypsin-like serine peptidase n=1 Tax=Bdellovibrio sp. ArHS TaxID=1569284 RepID=UPI000582FF16|nr:serine protease [Bdellovibrio sp. ArHS]KHD87478.1 MAG: hypothetical protein OM95_14415 [Bdellovibrio sp. ArHS]
MNKWAKAFLGIFLIQMAGCGFDAAPTSSFTSSPNNQAHVIYGADSIKDVVSGNMNVDSSVALMTKASAARWQKNENLQTVQDVFGALGLTWMDQPSLAFCSGVLVSSDLVLTAGHCLERIKCEDLAFVFNYQKDSQSQKRVVVDCQEVVAAKNALHEGLDYALIRLSQKVATASVKFSKKTLLAGQKIYSLGYPLGSLKKYAEGNVRELWSSPSVIISNLDVFEGNSGSPVFDAQTHELIGLLSSGERDFEADESEPSQDNLKVCDDHGCTGEFIVPIEKVLADLPK